MAYWLFDTGAWIALYDPADAHYDAAQSEIEPLLDYMSILIPWPIAYETMKSRFTRDRRRMVPFEQLLKRPSVERFDDTPYREDALRLAFDSALRGPKHFSLVDCLIRLILDDRDVNIDRLATFNARDFRDVCSMRNIELIGS